MTDNKERILILATGGTIDKAYSPFKQTTILKEKSIIPDYLSKVIGENSFVHFEQLMMIDSRDMDETHHQKILSAIQNSFSDKIIITHGTDTMVKTATYLQENMESINKTIIFTGSMIPLDGFYNSDSGFNLGFAIGTAHQKEQGIFICMNGQVFRPEKVQKNVEESRFEEVSAV